MKWVQRVIFKIFRSTDTLSLLLLICVSWWGAVFVLYFLFLCFVYLLWTAFPSLRLSLASFISSGFCLLSFFTGGPSPNFLFSFGFV